MRVCLVLGLVAVALAFEAMPTAYWKNLAHGVNSRSLYKPGRLAAWSASLTKLNCSLPAFSVPFDSMTSYGPAGVNPVDGSIALGLKCSTAQGVLPFLWIVPQAAGKQPRLVQLAKTSCRAQLREADVFEGYLNYLPDGGVIFGMCSAVYVLPLNSNTVRNLGSYGYSPSIISVINSSPPQLIIAGGRWDRWWEDWGAVAVNITGQTSQTITLDGAISIADTTIMFSPDGKTMYNGHFDQWAPGSRFGLQYWKTPFTTGSQPYANNAQCSSTRPWTYSVDSQGNVYSSLCDGVLLMKLDKNAKQVWNVSCPDKQQQCQTVERQQFFMTDDEKYIYVGSTRYGPYWASMYYVIDTRTGAIVKQVNVSRTTQEGASCESVYGPFASRWPIPLNGKTRAVYLCTINSNVTSVYSFDPFTNGWGVKKYNSVNGAAPILLTDSSDNIYSIGVDKSQHAFVRRFPA